MKRYHVKITDHALADMEAIYDYIALRLQVPDTAMEQYNRIADGIESLSEYPLRCKLMDSRPERDRGMRQRLVDNYTIVFVVDVDKAIVTILRVLYAASDIIARLRELD